MKEIRKEEISQEVFDLYDDYAHNRIDRRQFLNKLSADDLRLKSDFITYNSPKCGGEIKGLLSQPGS